MIIPFALRIAAVGALSGNTLAEARVQDSAVEALDDLAQEQPKPFIIVSTDEQTYDLRGYDVTAGTRQCDLVLDIAVASAVEVEGGEPGELSIFIPHTDAGLELAVNMVTRQAMRALFEPNSGGNWGKIFRAIGGRVTRVLVRRGAGVKGVRFAAAQLIISLETLQEPAFGQPPQDIWADFLDAVRADPKIAPQASMIEAMIVGDAIPEWRYAASILGVDDEVAGGIGLFPVAISPSGGAPLAEQATVSPDGWIIDEAAIEENVPDEQ